MFFKTKEQRKIVEYSNIIQYDEMGYPLRFVIDNYGKHLWIDTTKMDGDVVLVWTK